MNKSKRVSDAHWEVLVAAQNCGMNSEEYARAYRRYIEINESDILPLYDGDTLHDGDFDPLDYVRHECDLGEDVIAVRKGYACPNHRFGCSFVAPSKAGEA